MKNSVRYMIKDGGVLARVNSALKLSGFFMFDSVTEVLCNKHYGERSRKLGGVRFLEKSSYYPRRKIAITTFQFEDGSEEIHLQKPYGLRELAPLLYNSGFVIYNRFSSPEGSYTDPGVSDWSVLLVRRNVYSKI